MTRGAEANPASQPFNGFPNSARAIVIPSLFFSGVMPTIEDPTELAVSVYFFFAAGPDRTRGRRPPFVTRRELEADAGLQRSLSTLGREGALDRGLALAVRRGVLLRSSIASNAGGEEVYAVNTPANYRALEALAEGGTEMPATLPAASADATPNIFALYEQNIGAITPLAADELRDAEGRYPAAWIEAAFREAVELNKRNWRYIERILQRWETEGPSYEEPGRDTEREWLARRYREGKRGPRNG